MRSMLDAGDRAVLVSRIRSLRPDAAARWGKMNAPRMIAHLGDQVRHALGDLATLEGLIARFVADETRTVWPSHAFFGGRSRCGWGCFSHRHFDHHLRQFGA